MDPHADTRGDWLGDAGLPAKPILDVAVGLAPGVDPDRAVAALQPLDFQFWSARKERRMLSVVTTTEQGDQVWAGARFERGVLAEWPPTDAGTVAA